MGDWAVPLVSLAYLSLLFVVAWIGDRYARKETRSRAPIVYPLSIAVYCSSWTLYGAVGEAATSGFNYLAIYVGPALVMMLGWPLIQRMIRIARAENSVSISDFISARYGKSRALAALITLTALIGLLPYFALQLKAITISFETLTGGGGAAPGGTTFVVAVAMAAFAVLFGVRGVNANEHHRGLMLAVATESVVKLTAAVLVGAAIVFLSGPSGGPPRITPLDPELARLTGFDAANPVWWATCLLSALAFLCLPRQFHVAIVENTHLADVRAAAWAFPAYLVAINLFVLPVALAGMRLFPDGTVQPDSFLVAIPLALGWNGLAFIAFLGGLSAATGMIIVATLALGTMLSNDVILPMLSWSRRLRARLEINPVPLVILARRLAVVGTIALAYLCYLVIGPAFPLAKIGLMSFAAVAQFSPALLGGLFWRRATGRGAFAGITAGFAGWVYAIAVPAFIAAGWLPADWVTSGPAGLAALNPVAIGGLPLDPMLNGMLWTLGPNLAFFVGVSVMTRPGPKESLQAERFVVTLPATVERDGGTGVATLADLHALAARYVGRERADETFNALALTRQGPLASTEDRLLARADAESAQVTERLLAGAIGAASARVVVASLISDKGFSRGNARGLIDEASRAILSTHELMRDTLQNIRQGLCAFDAEERVTLWNRRFLELIDLPRDLVRVGTPLEEIVRFNAARHEYGLNDEYETLLARRRNPDRRDRLDIFERRRPDGTVLEIATTPLPSGGFVAVYTDVSDRYRAAAALREANETLEQRIAERTHALLDAKAEAERANLGKTRFLAAAGHDLLQPMQAAHLFLSAMSERVQDPAIAQIDAALRSVEHLLGELLEVSKIDSGVTLPVFTDFRISDLLRPLGEEFSVLATRADLGFRLVPSSATVRSDPALLRRILQNFLSNAVRYTPRGRILLGCRHRGGELEIEVWDTGEGIPDEKQREIFIEFRRLDSTATEQGLGLGLAIVERLAGLLGHGVSVRSTRGRGSCFSVRVPLAVAPAAELPMIERPRPRNFGGALVVFVENEPAIAGAMSDLLTGWSCEVITAPTATAALAELRGRRPHVVLSDYHLDHGRTGLDALASIRAALGPHMSAALLTADRDPALRAAAEQAGYRVLHKPIRPGALRALLGQMLTEQADQAAE